MSRRSTWRSSASWAPPTRAACWGWPTPAWGEEAGKGSEAVQEAYGLLAASGLNFAGNLEGRDIPSGVADVAVVVGCTGNVLIKFAEGLGQLVERMLSDAARADPLGVLGGLLFRPSLRRARARMDYRAYGGAVLLGVRGLVVVGHGRSDAEAVRVAIDVAQRGVSADVVGAIARGTAGGRGPQPLEAETASAALQAP
jgi:glycerol-3-phosphate acyltransferase PlsX